MICGLPVIVTLSSTHIRGNTHLRSLTIHRTPSFPQAPSHIVPFPSSHLLCRRTALRRTPQEHDQVYQAVGRSRLCFCSLLIEDLPTQSRAHWENVRRRAKMQPVGRKPASIRPVVAAAGITRRSTKILSVRSPTTKIPTLLLPPQLPAVPRRLLFRHNSVLHRLPRPIPSKMTAGPKST